MIYQLSNIGTRHSLSGEENQDVICFDKNNRYTVITLADGVSSCEKAREGAEIASRAITNLFLKKGDYFMDFSKEQISDFAVSHIVYELTKEAKKNGRSVEDYSSTIASVLYDKKKKRILFFNIGDGLIFASDNEKCRILAMPSDSSSGCGVTTTKNISAASTAEIIDAGTIETITICSDGAWKNMINGNRLKREVINMISVGKYDELKDYLEQRPSFDDYSIISLKLPRGNRRKVA